MTALTLGAHGVLLKDALASALCDCVRAVARGDYWIGREEVRDLVQALRRVDQPAPAPSPADTLTARELQMVGAVFEGASNRDIALRFNLSEQTVKNHLTKVFDKVGVSSRLELALYAGHHHLLDRGTATPTLSIDQR